MSPASFVEPLDACDAGSFELVNAATGSVLAASLEAAFDRRARRRGLLGHRSLPPRGAMILAPCRVVHTLFMRFPIDLVFVARDGTVLKTRRSVLPWRMAGAWRAFAVVEAAPGSIDRSGTLAGHRMVVRERRADPLRPVSESRPSPRSPR